MSAVLSRIFFWLFWLTVGMMVLKVSNEVGRVATNSVFGFFGVGEGITVEARSVSTEHTWPDTLISYKLRAIGQSGDTITLRSGAEVLGLNEGAGGPALQELINQARLQNEILKLDTTVNVGMVREIQPASSDFVSYGIDSSVDGRVVVSQSLKQGNKDLPVLSDTFTSARDANIFIYTGAKTNNTLFSKGYSSVRATVTMLPSGAGQKLVFILWDFLKLGCLAAIFFTLYRLFRQFAKEDYFNLGNATFIRNLGILLITSEFLKLVFYFVYLAGKTLFSLTVDSQGAVSSQRQYIFDADISIPNIVFGCGMLVLSYVFMEAWRLQQEQKLTI